MASEPTTPKSLPMASTSSPKGATPARTPLPLNTYKEDVHSDWCPGCGDFGILSSIQMAMSELGLPPHRTALFSGVGCSGKTPHYVKVYGVHTLHGRVLPFALGCKLANPELEVIAVGGDGDGYGIGAGHFVNTGRRNVDMAYVVYNNGVYGLTKGQASPTLRLGMQTKSLPTPNINQNVNPIATAIAAGYTWVGRGYAYDVKQLKSLIKEAILHKGAALLDVLQPCPTYNNLNTKEFYQPRVRPLEKDNYDGRVKDAGNEEEVYAKVSNAIAKSMAWGDVIPTGVFYNIDISTYEERVRDRLPSYPEHHPANATYADEQGHPTTDLKPFMKGLRVVA